MATFYFPTLNLEERQKKLSILWQNDVLLAIEKPSGIAIEKTDNAFSLIPELKKQLEEGNKNLHKFKKIKSIIDLDVSISGCALLAGEDEAISNYRNAYGSGQFVLHFILLSHGTVQESNLICELPLYYCQYNNESKISHRQGKKSKTEFLHKEYLGNGYHLWEAKTSYYRPHQLFLHAKALGLTIVGDSCTSPPIYLSQLKKKFYKGLSHELPLYNAPALHLHQIDMPENTINIPPPDNFNVLLQKIRKYAH